jgi:hypothetical protein
MKIKIVERRIILAPESQAEVYQLESIAQDVRTAGISCGEYRQWDIQTLTLFCEPQ